MRDTQKERDIIVSYLLDQENNKLTDLCKIIEHILQYNIDYVEGKSVLPHIQGKLREAYENTL